MHTNPRPDAAHQAQRPSKVHSAEPDDAAGSSKHPSADSLPRVIRSLSQPLRCCEIAFLRPWYFTTSAPVLQPPLTPTRDLESNRWSHVKSQCLVEMNVCVTLSHKTRGCNRSLEVAVANEAHVMSGSVNARA